MKNEENILTPQEVADMLKIAKNTVYELIKRGELNAFKVGKKFRIDLCDVEEYKNSTKQRKSNSLTDRNQAEKTSFSNNNPLYYEMPPQQGFIICGQDPLLDILSLYLERHPKGTRTLRSYMGSYNGLHALYQGDVDVATAHLWDSDTGEYNIPFTRRILPGIPVLIIHLACRMQGFYVAKGNPKNITGWEDLKRNDISIVTREKGSGTRILLDEHLRKLGISGSQIKGYTRESISHLAVASTISRGGADIGIGTEKTSFLVKDIEFIPLQKERYEMVIKKDDLHKEIFKALLEIITSTDFKMELESIGGYDITETGNIIAET